MAEFRTLPTGMWTKDEWFMDLPTSGKLLWIWMQTNDKAGEAWQPLIPSRIMMETGISRSDITALFDSFEQAGRIETSHTTTGVFRIFLSDTRCAKCGAGFDMTVDHVKPRSWGGTNDGDNLQWLCRNCNSSKGNRHDTRY